MKTKNLLTRISASALFAAAALLPAALTSCSSDSEPAPNPDPIPEGMARLNLSFATPADRVYTRADREATQDEASITSLWLLIFNESKEIYKAIDCTGKLPTGQDYVDYSKDNSGNYLYTPIYGTSAQSGEGLSIPGGKYYIYMLANIENYIDEDAKTLLATSEDPSETGLKVSDLEAIELDFNKTSGKELIKLTRALPMAATCKDVEATNSGTSVIDGNGCITIANGTVDIKVKMSFLCSAVRYTILFDKSAGAESQFYNNFQMNSNPVSIKNVLDGYTIYGSGEKVETADDSFTAITSGAKYSFSGSIADFIESPDFLTTAVEGDYTTDKRAYQGVLYLPENCASSNSLKTILKFSYQLDGVAKTPEMVLPTLTEDTADGNVLKRANYYDVIGKLTSAGMEFYVKVNPWEKQPTKYIPF